MSRRRKGTAAAAGLGVMEGVGVPVVVGELEGVGVPDGVPDGVGLPVTVCEGVDELEGDWGVVGLLDGVGLVEPVWDGVGLVEPVWDGVGLFDGVGLVEPVWDGVGLFDGVDVPEGVSEGDAVLEGVGVKRRLTESTVWMFDATDAPQMSWLIAGTMGSAVRIVKFALEAGDEELTVAPTGPPVHVPPLKGSAAPTGWSAVVASVHETRRICVTGTPVALAKEQRIAVMFASVSVAFPAS